MMLLKKFMELGGKLEGEFDDIVIDGLRFVFIMEQVKNLERQPLKVEYMMFLFMVTPIKEERTRLDRH